MNSDIAIDQLVRKKNDQDLLDIEVKPGSKNRGMRGFDPWRKRFVVNVRSPAQKGKANKEVVEVVEAQPRRMRHGANL